MDDFYDKLLVELECPICTNYMAPPIRQCATGHSICQSCRKKLPKCPLCQGPFTDSKNISLEALACKMHYPCINRSLGCEAKLSLDERENHENNCTYKGFKCGIEKCPWSGKLEDVVEHWNSKKNKSKIYRSFNVCHTKVKTESYYANLVDVHDQLFWFKCKLEKGKIFWAVQLIGPTDKAGDYFYDIEIFKPGPSKPKIIFSDYCQSVNMENSDLFKEGVCVMMSTDCLSRFVGDDQILIYYMRVRETAAEESSNNKKAPVSEGAKRSKNRGDKHFDKNRDRSKGAASYAADKGKKGDSSHKEAYNKLKNQDN